jgi:circadian clock protein KaiB
MKPPTYRLRLYVSRSAARSIRAIENLTRLCEQHLRGRYVLEVIDVVAQADLARSEQIVAVPTLIKRRPLPFHRLIGDMSDPGKVLAGLNVELRMR